MSEEDLRKIIKDHFKIKDGNLSINIKDKIIKIFDVGVQYENKEEKPNLSSLANPLNSPTISILISLFVYISIITISSGPE